MRKVDPNSVLHERLEDLDDSIDSISIMAQALQSNPCPGWRVRLAVDQNGQPQAMSLSLIKTSSISILHLATNPANIVPLDREQRCKGPGREVVFSTIKDAIQLQIPEIELASLRRSKLFYVNLGFELKDQNSSIMHLTAEKIWDLYPHFIIPGIDAPPRLQPEIPAASLSPKGLTILGEHAASQLLPSLQLKRLRESPEMVLASAQDKSPIS